MSIYMSVTLILLTLAYIVSIIFFVTKYNKNKQAEIMMLNANEEKFRTFYFEQKVLIWLDIDAEKIKTIIWVERILLLTTLIVLIYLFKGLGMCMIGSIVIIFLTDDMYKKVIFDSGINNIVNVNNFINYFIPHINSGNSADQSFLGYVNYSKDKDLAEYYEHRDDPSFKLKANIKQIITIYDIAKYNEDKGISNYTYILNEISKDYEQKQAYYNKFAASIGEVKPTVWSYYVGVPSLIAISFSQTSLFWSGMWGSVLSFALLILFTAFKFLILKLQKNTINSIF